MMKTEYQTVNSSDLKICPTSVTIKCLFETVINLSVLRYSSVTLLVYYNLATVLVGNSYSQIWYGDNLTTIPLVANGRDISGRNLQIIHKKLCKTCDYSLLGYVKKTLQQFLTVFHFSRVNINFLNQTNILTHSRVSQKHSSIKILSKSNKNIYFN